VRYPIIWTPERVASLRRLMAERARPNEIASALGVTEAQVSTKIALLRHIERTAAGNTARATPQSVIDEREARAEAAWRRNQTQEFFGDPPPGYSALDRKRSSAAP
jgi:hypothetical protein